MDISYFINNDQCRIKDLEMQSIVLKKHKLDEIYNAMPDLILDNFEKSSEIYAIIPSDNSYVVLISHHYEHAMGWYLGVVSIVKEGKFIFGEPWKSEKHDNKFNANMPFVYRHGFSIDEENQLIWFKMGACFLIFDVKRGLYCTDYPYGYMNREITEEGRALRIKKVSEYKLSNNFPRISQAVEWEPVTQ